MSKTIAKPKKPKLCKHCKEPLENRKWTYHVECAIQAKKERAFRKRLANDEFKKLKKDAWDAFSEHLRRFYADNEGNCTCVTCGAVKPWKQMQAGHGVRGRGGYVLFNKKIVRPQCYYCNIVMKGRYDDFMYYLVEIEKSLTADEYFDIKRESMKTHKLTRQDYERILNEMP